MEQVRREAARAEVRRRRRPRLPALAPRIRARADARRAGPREPHHGPARDRRRDERSEAPRGHGSHRGLEPEALWRALDVGDAELRGSCAETFLVMRAPRPTLVDAPMEVPGARQPSCVTLRSVGPRAAGGGGSAVTTAATLRYIV